MHTKFTISNIPALNPTPKAQRRSSQRVAAWMGAWLLCVGAAPVEDRLRADTAVVSVDKAGDLVGILTTRDIMEALIALCRSQDGGGPAT